jgi:hypothetical protein
MSSTKITLVFLVSFLLILNSCATILGGYEYTIDLINAPEDIKVFDREDVEIPVFQRAESNYSQSTREIEWTYIKMISLRKNKEHVLILKSGDNEKRITVYPKIGAGWLIVDLVTGIFPVFIDAYTGNWHYFDDINAAF